MNTTIRSIAAAVATAAIAFSAPVSAQQKVRIGFISTFSGPQGVMGQFMKESVELAIDHLGGKVGGLPVEMDGRVQLAEGFGDPPGAAENRRFARHDVRANLLLGRNQGGGDVARPHVFGERG